MSKILCPFCFEKTEVSQLEYRCSYTRCSGKREDVILAQAQGLLSPTIEGLVFTPTKKGLGRLFGKSNQLEKCPNCNKETSIKVCPKCHYNLKYLSGEIEEKMIAIMGGRSSSKSTYISVLVNRLQNEIGKNFKAGVMFTDDKSRTIYEEIFRKPIFVREEILQATVSSTVDSRAKTPMILRVTFDNNGQRKAVNLVLFDTAGEDMEDIDIMSSEARYLCEADGIIFILDPLQIETVRQLVKEDLPDRLESADPNRIVERLYELHEQKLKIKAGKKIEKPIAFTLSKSDALFPFIEADSVLHHSGEHFGYLNLPDVESVHTEICTYLEEWMGSAFDNKVKTYFNCYRYFAMSPLGKNPIKGKIEGLSPLRIEDPLLWLFSQFQFIQGRK
ncbi:hypothetical protein MTo_00466 [Microcystis aeruginosa NIES-1211]|uniref:TRAFAC clade GTPase domain-containing protein n=1 Tax=Microcystis TaxID=1125 RepID=UPI000D7BCCB9|nr:hypothetical protein [Microcystis aeruginosa]GBL13176.1 hypothetical protein MTo_00466 [Microcystis aeruginosa NIES-1211]